MQKEHIEHILGQTHSSGTSNIKHGASRAGTCDKTFQVCLLLEAECPFSKLEPFSFHCSCDEIFVMATKSKS